MSEYPSHPPVVHPCEEYQRPLARANVLLEVGKRRVKLRYSVIAIFSSVLVGLLVLVLYPKR